VWSWVDLPVLGRPRRLSLCSFVQTTSPSSQLSSNCTRNNSSINRISHGIHMLIVSCKSSLKVLWTSIVSCYMDKNPESVLKIFSSRHVSARVWIWESEPPRFPHLIFSSKVAKVFYTCNAPLQTILDPVAGLCSILISNCMQALQICEPDIQTIASHIVDQRQLYWARSS
jgi:hypothetical protein